MEMTQEELIHCWGIDYFEHCFKHAQKIRKDCWEANCNREPFPEEEEPAIDLILAVAIAETIQRVIVVSDRTRKDL